MRQVRDSLVWLAMIMVVAGVIYVMPRVATYVAAAESDPGAGSVSHIGGVSAPYHGFAHAHHRSITRR